MLKKFTQDKFLKNNIIFFCGSMAVAFLNYLYYPFLGRMMKIGDFGEAQAFISFVLIFGVFSGIFKNVITNIVANSKGEEQKETILMMQKFSYYFSFAIAAILIIFGSHFVAFFNFDVSYLFIVMAILIVLGVSYATHSAVIQGLHDFKTLSIASIIMAGGKVLFSVILVYFGLAVLGAVGGLILAQLAALVYVIIYTHKNFRLGHGLKTKIDGRIKKELWYAFLVFAASFAVTFLYTSDTIIVKKFFSADIAGFYGGIATIGRIIFFATGSVAGVLLPAIKMEDKENNNKKHLFKAIILTSLIGGIGLLTFSLFPDTVIRILMGGRYLQYSHLLPLVSLFLFIVSLCNLLFFYLLALRKNFVFFAALVGPAIVITMCALRHSVVDDVIFAFLIGSLATLLMLSIKIGIELFRKNKYEQIDLGSGPSLQ